MERLKQLRNEKGLLQKEIAQKLGVDRTTYVKYENGTSEPNFQILIRLADYFSVSLDYLLGRTDEKSAPPMTGEALCNRIEKEYGSLAWADFSLYLRLDGEDRAVLRGEMRQMLRSRKYEQEVAKHA